VSWTCQRITSGEKCGSVNENRKRNCWHCGKPRAKRKPPEHRAILSMPYEWWVDKFGEQCGICGKGPSVGRRLDRDHDHKSGTARGLLCHRHNRGLDWFADLDELRRAVAYLEIAERRRLATMLDERRV
jgi:hypothetical protein